MSAKVTHHRVLCPRAMLRWSLWSEYMGVDSSLRQTPVGESEKSPFTCAVVVDVSASGYDLATVP